MRKQPKKEKNSNRLINTENKMAVARGEGSKEIGEGGEGD